MITIPARLTREFIIQHPEWTFVHSKCYWPGQCVGPCEICQGLDNCFGVVVRWKLCKSSGYFSDNQRDIIMAEIDRNIAEIPRDKPIVLFPKIGCGQSRMIVFAPKCYVYLHKKLDEIKAEFKYDYSA